jgi:hypothetical protein
MAQLPSYQTGGFNSAGQAAVQAQLKKLELDAAGATALGAGINSAAQSMAPVIAKKVGGEAGLTEYAKMQAARAGNLEQMSRAPVDTQKKGSGSIGAAGAKKDAAPATTPNEVGLAESAFGMIGKAADFMLNAAGVNATYKRVRKMWDSGPTAPGDPSNLSTVNSGANPANVLSPSTPTPVTQ